MKTLIKIEELGLFGLGIYLFSLLPYAWWWFLVLVLVPDVSMLGYAFGNRAGAWSYNLFHHRGVAVAVYLSGVVMDSNLLLLAGALLFAHASMDRMFGYGLKYEKGFKFTHLENL